MQQREQPIEANIHMRTSVDHLKFSLRNFCHYISFVDATRYSTVRFIKTKSAANQAIIDYILELETQYGCRTKALRSDNGGEYVNEQLNRSFAQKGMSHDLTPPYFPESNGVAEKLNRTIGEGPCHYP
ncbi:hypothetical protein K3495_g499 [Podosphaera aphanis]|nr:hypothetical protein K3495_g499 [Podosphaera aphanis]